jgi:hypothetical protein
MANVKVECDECTKEASVSLCNGCMEERLEEAASNATVGMVDAHDSEEEARTTVAQLVADWLERERLKPGVTMSPETIAAFENCIEDLR